MDRDVVASMNIAYKGWSRFCHPRGLPGEAMRGNVGFDKNPLILRVDGSTLAEGQNKMKTIIQNTSNLTKVNTENF
jgi:putative transposase